MDKMKMVLTIALTIFTVTQKILKFFFHKKSLSANLVLRLILMQIENFHYYRNISNYLHQGDLQYFLEIRI